MSLFVSAALYEPGGTTRTKHLGAAANIQWLDELDGPGSFSFDVPVSEAGPLAVGYGVKFTLGTDSDAVVFGGIIEAVEVQDVGDNNPGTNRIYKVRGRGFTALLDQAIVYNDAADPGSTIRAFAAANPGEIMDLLLDEAQARGALTDLTPTFTTSVDSNADAYAETITIELRVGETMLQIADQIRELAADVWVSSSAPWSFDLNIANSRGTDRTTGANPMVLRAGYHLGEFVHRSEGPVKNAILVSSGPEGKDFATEEDAASISTYGRQEGFLSLANTDDPAQVALASGRLLANLATPATSITVAMNALDLIPYIDFELGDTLSVADSTGAQEDYRLRSISVSVGETGLPIFVPEFGTIRADLQRRMDRALKRIERGNLTAESTTATVAADVNYNYGAGVGGYGQFANNYLYSTELFNNTSTNTFSAGGAFAVPFTVWQQSTIDAFVVHVRDGTSNDANAYRARVGIYTEVAGMPAEKVVESAEFNFGNGTYASPSMATLTIASTVLAAGRYWLVFKRYNTTTAANPAYLKGRGTVGTRGPITSALALSGTPGNDSQATSTWELTGLTNNSTTLPQTLTSANLNFLTSFFPEVWVRGA